MGVNIPGQQIGGPRGRPQSAQQFPQEALEERTLALLDSATITLQAGLRLAKAQILKILDNPLHLVYSEREGESL